MNSVIAFWLKCGVVLDCLAACQLSGR